MKKTLVYAAPGGDIAEERETFDWKDAITDASIIAAITFFTALGGGQVIGFPTLQSLYAAGVAAATQFFVMLGIKRGVVKK
jgi:hypothetical protein